MVDHRKKRMRIITDDEQAGRVIGGAYAPIQGDLVTNVHNDPSRRLWRIVHLKGRMYDREGFRITSVRGARYSGHGAGNTWVLECIDGETRNPVWTDPEQNLSGEGTHEQRHCVVTRTKLGQIEYWFFPTADDEIKSITTTSKVPIDVHYRSSNRTSATVTPSAKDAERGGGYICCISDYLYFSPEACKLRECCVASGFTSSTPGETPPVYTYDFAKYMPTPPLPVVPGIEAQATTEEAAPAHSAPGAATD